MPLKDLTSIIGPANWRNVEIPMIPIIRNLPTNPRLRVLTLSLTSLETNPNLRILDPPIIDFPTLDLPPLNPNPPMLVSLVQMERSPKLRKIDVVKKGYVCTAFDLDLFRLTSIKAPAPDMTPAEGLMKSPNERPCPCWRNPCRSGYRDPTNCCEVW